MGDMNAAVNQDTRMFTASRNFFLDWENSGKLKILNDKNKYLHKKVNKRIVWT